MVRMPKPIASFCVITRRFILFYFHPTRSPSHATAATWIRASMSRAPCLSISPCCSKSRCRSVECPVPHSIRTLSTHLTRICLSTMVTARNIMSHAIGPRTHNVKDPTERDKAHIIHINHVRCRMLRCPHSNRSILCVYVAGTQYIA
jgi:hypothetical protein